MSSATRDIVVVGASAGGVQALQALVRGLPRDFPASVLGVMHISPTTESALPSLTAFASLADKDRARASGFDRHMSKPVEPLQLLITLQQMAPTRGFRGMDPLRELPCLRVAAVCGGRGVPTIVQVPPGKFPALTDG